MYLVNDIKTGFARSGSNAPDVWTETELSYAGKSTHGKNRIYKDIGKSSGYISMELDVPSYIAFSGFCIFRVRTNSITEGPHYNCDVYNGFSLMWHHSSPDYNGLIVTVNPSSSDIRSGVVRNFGLKENKTITIDAFWDNYGFTIVVDGEVFSYKYNNSINTTVFEMGFSNYSGRFTRRLVQPNNNNNIEISSEFIQDNTLSFSVKPFFENIDVNINKVDVLINNVLSQTYNENFDNLTYIINENLCYIGNNRITIRVTYNGSEYEEKVLNYVYNISQLPAQSSLQDINKRISFIVNSKKNERDTLANILESKNVEVTEEDKMSDLIGKVDMLGEYDNPILYLYKDGDECASITGGWEGTNFSTFSKGTLTKNSDNINLTCPSGNYWIVASTTNKVDITKYSKLKIEYKGNVRTSYGVSTSINPCNFTSYSSTNTSYNGIVEHNISSLSGSYYVNVGSEGSANTNIYKVWLEK